MVPEPENCPECGAVWVENRTCQDDFYQLLYWENERPELGEVHHLLVLCYHLQHPGLYSPEGLRYAITLLDDFLHHDLTPQTARTRSREQMGSSERKWKVTARPGQHGAYPRPPVWRMTAADVVAGGIDRYRENVTGWAHSIWETLQGLEHD